MVHKKALLLLVVLLGSLSGCNFVDQTSPSATTTETNTQSETTKPETTQPPITGSETAHQFAPNDRLIIDKIYNGSITVRVFDSQEVYNRSQSNESTAQNSSRVRYSEGRTGEIHVAEVDLDGYVVVETESGTVWEGPIDPYTRYELRIHEDGSIERTSLDFI